MKEEIRIDVRNQTPERLAEQKRCAELCFKINQTMPTSAECKKLISELFNNSLGENTVIQPPLYTILADKIRIGNNVTILNGFKCMSAGGLIIEDNTMISLNCVIATNNHDFYDNYYLQACTYKKECMDWGECYNITRGNNRRKCSCWSGCCCNKRCSG